MIKEYFDVIKPKKILELTITLIMIIDYTYNRLYVDGFQTNLENARMFKYAYVADIKELMNQVGIATEFETTIQL